MSKSLHIENAPVLSFACFNVNVNLPIYNPAVRKEDYKYFVPAGFYFVKYEKTFIIRDDFVLFTRTANSINTGNIFTT